MIKTQQHQKSIISGFIAGLYLLLLVFSPYLHQHHADPYFGFSNTKNPKFENISQKKIGSANDCLACHFSTTNHSIAPKTFEFKIYNSFPEKLEFSHLKENFLSFETTRLYLRGPPVHQL